MINRAKFYFLWLLLATSITNINSYGDKMFPQSVDGILKQASDNKWTFPQSFNALKEAGVCAYDVDVATESKTFYSKNASHRHSVSGNAKREVKSIFNSDLIQQAILGNQAQKISYEEFLDGIAVAGVVTYSVDLEKRAVEYKGAQGEVYKESIPLF